MKKKARSRLSKSQVNPPAESSKGSVDSKRIPVNTNAKSDQAKNASILKKYIKHLPTLILSLPFYFATYYIINNIPPENIKHSFLVNAYLPLQALQEVNHILCFALHHCN